MNYDLLGGHCFSPFILAVDRVCPRTLSYSQFGHSLCLCFQYTIRSIDWFGMRVPSDLHSTMVRIHGTTMAVIVETIISLTLFPSRSSAKTESFWTVWASRLSWYLICCCSGRSNWICTQTQTIRSIRAKRASLLKLENEFTCNDCLERDKYGRQLFE